MGHVAAPAEAPTPPQFTQTGRAWTMQLTDEPGALMRVLTLLRRRQCQILNVDYAAGDGHGPARLRVHVRPSGGRPDSIEPWLQGLIGVLGVTRER